MNVKEFSKRNWLILLLFGAIGQIAWTVENMYFNLFVFDTVAKDLGTITLMVQLSGVMATLVTLVERNEAREVTLLNSHLDHIGEGARQEGAHLLCETIRPYLGGAAFITGQILGINGGFVV